MTETTIKTMSLDTLIQSPLRQATRDHRFGRFNLRMELQNDLHIDYYPEWHRDTGADHISFYAPGSCFHRGARCLETPEEWRAISQAEEARLIAILQSIHPHLFSRTLRTITREELIKDGESAARVYGRDAAVPNIWAIASLLKENGMIRVPVVISFTEPVEMPVNKKNKKTMSVAKVYCFMSTAGHLCYSFRTKAHVASGFRFTDDMAAKVDRITETNI